MGLFTTEKPDTIKYKKVKEDACVVTFSVEVPPQKVQDETHNYLLALQQRAKLPGFRPGKAPLDLVKKQLGGHAREEVLDRLIRRAVPEGIEQLKLRPVATPTITTVDFKEGKPLKFEVAVEIAPVFTPKDYAKIKVSRKSYATTDEALDARLNELREANARLERAPEDAVAANHYVVIDFSGFSDGKPLPKIKGDNELVDMSSDQTVEGLSAGLLGLKRGETKDVEVKLSEKPATLRVTVKEIKAKILPALDAEFSKDVGFASLDELKAKLREVMDSEGKNKTERELSQQIEEALLKSNKIPVPPSLVEAQLENMIERLRRQLFGAQSQMSEQQLSDLRAKLQPRAEDEVRIQFLLPAIAEKEKVAVSDEELLAELEKSLAAADTQEKKDEIRLTFETRREAIAAMMRDRKTLQLLREKAVISDA